MDFIKTLLISCIPAIITGAVTYLVAYKNSIAQIKVVEEQNKHDLDKLMEQHKIDIDSLKKKSAEVCSLVHKSVWHRSEINVPHSLLRETLE